MYKMLSLMVGAVGLALVALTAGAQAQTELQSLRGAVPVTETSPPPELQRQETRSGRFRRAYRQQPPMIPHKVDKYEIDLKVNECMRCHDWPFNVEEHAPKISETHYFDRNGVALDRVATSRWFCTQCHVPQIKARELVPNEFKSAIEVGRTE